MVVDHENGDVRVSVDIPLRKLRANNKYPGALEVAVASYIETRAEALAQEVLDYTRKDITMSGVEQTLQEMGLHDVGLNADWSLSAYQLDGTVRREGLLLFDNEDGTWGLKDTIKGKEYVTLMDEYIVPFIKAWLYGDVSQYYLNGEDANNEEA